jgi:Predicted integral membrane protein (DUF2269)
VSTYVIVLFLHISGALGYFISAGTRSLNMIILQRAQRVEQVRIITTLDNWLVPLFGISLLTLVVTGLYMTITTWGFNTGWIDVALISVILMAPAGALLMEPRRRAIVTLARELPDGPIPSALQRHIHNRVLQATARALPLLLLGIVFLMTTKPSLGGSILVMAVALTLSLAVGVLIPRPTSDRKAQTAVQ